MSLTDDWKNKKLKTGQRFFISINGCNAEPATIDIDKDFVDMEGLPVNPYTNEIQVLAPCDYDHFVELTEKVKTLSLENERLERELRQKVDYIHEILEIKDIYKNLLKECKPYIKKEMETIKGAGFCNCDWAWKTSDLLTRIKATIGESEGRC